MYPQTKAIAYRDGYKYHIDLVSQHKGENIYKIVKVNIGNRSPLHEKTAISSPELPLNDLIKSQFSIMLDDDVMYTLFDNLKLGGKS